MYHFENKRLELGEDEAFDIGEEQVIYQRFMDD